MGKDRAGTASFSMTVNVLAVGGGFVAATRLGGITVKSPFCSDQNDAAMQLFARIANNNDDAGLGVALALQGSSLESELNALPKGGDDGGS